MVEESELARRSAAGDAEAFGTLFERYAGDVYRLARSMGHAGEEAEDVTQDTFLAAFERVVHFEGRSSFKTWLFAILFRQSSRRHRYLVRRKMDVYDESDTAPTNGATRAWTQPRTDTRLDALAMLDTLSPEHRSVLVLRELQGLSYEEIAATLDIPRGTVESRLYRARAQLRDRFHDYGAPPKSGVTSEESKHG